MFIRGQALALKRFSVAAHQWPPRQPLVLIEGRRPGITAFMLNALGIDASTTLVVTQRDVTFTSGSLFGQVNSMMPLTAVASVHAGFSKPLHYLVLAALFAMGSLGGLFQLNEAGVAILAVNLALAAIFVVLYVLGKRFALFVESSGGATFGLVFKPSVIEGVQVDLARVQAVVDITRDLILAAHGAPAPAAAHAPAPSGWAQPGS